MDRATRTEQGARWATRSLTLASAQTPPRPLLPIRISPDQQLGGVLDQRLPMAWIAPRSGDSDACSVSPAPP